MNATAKFLLPLQQIITADVATTTAAKFVPTRLAISSERYRSSQSSTSPPITPLQSAASISAESAITFPMCSPPAPQQSVETTTQPSTSTTPTGNTSSPLWTLSPRNHASHLRKRMCHLLVLSNTKHIKWPQENRPLSVDSNVLPLDLYLKNTF